MPKTYSQGGFSVTINDDGSILVKPGDSLSKYSMAIHGDFNHLKEYSRKNGNSLKPIEDLNFIKTGETLFHNPSIPNNISPAPHVPAAPMNDRDKQVLLEKVLREHNIPASQIDTVKWIINGGRLTQLGVTLATAPDFFALFALPPALGMANAIAGPALAISGSIYALWKARNYSIRQAGMRGTAYATVAWTFNHVQSGLGRPGLPEAIARSLRETGKPEDVQFYTQTWNAAVAESLAKLDTLPVQYGYAKEEIQLVFAAIGRGDPKRLAVTLMLDIAEQYFADNDYDRRNFLQPWVDYPNDRYVGRPTYPPELDRRYPY